jgi:hypothetical protein
VSFDEVLFMDDPVTAAGKDETAFANLGYEPLILGPHGPLALVRGDDTALRLHLLFHPDRSTLPFRVAFPILASNLVAHAQKLAGLSESVSVATGVLPAHQFTSGTSVNVSGPEKFTRTEKADERGFVTGIPAPRVGEYVLSAGGGNETRLGVSLLSTNETGLTTVNEVEFGDRISVATASVAPKADRSLWWTLAALGFAVLLIEWWWFQRRTV